LTRNIHADIFLRDMTWRVFREINRSLFALPKKPTTLTFYKLAAAVVSVAGLIGAYLKAPDGVAHWLIQNLITFPAPKLQDALTSWDSGNHVALRIASAFALLAVVYAGAFALAAQERLDFRSELARAVGVKFLSVRRSHDITDLDGLCRTTSLEDFEVYDIHLSHIDRHLQLTSGATWPNRPEIDVEGLPNDHWWNFEVQDEGSRRTYVLNFTKALHQTVRPVRLRISDVIPKAFWMYEDETPVHPVFETHVEATSWFVVEPIDRLELAVTFPYGYRVGGQTQVSVRYKGTRTVHNPEEERLRNSSSLNSKEENGRQVLQLVVEEPIVGLQYYLYWEPPKRPAQRPLTGQGHH
jgi:hypothetical protein